MILASPSRRRSALRQQAISVGVPEHVADTTPASDLAAIIEASSQLRLVIVEDADPDSYPRLGIPLTREQQMINEGHSLDEVFAVRGLMPPGGMADDFGPLDEYTGGDAA